jgi:hypothetical protein
MKNKAFFKILLSITLLALFGAFLFVINAPTVYAEGGEIVDTLGGDEADETTTDETPVTTTDEDDEEQEEEQAVTLTEEEKGKLDSIVEWLSKLNKEELFELLGTVKNWLIAGGIVTVLGFLSAIIGLIAAILKLSREKTKNSELSEENKKKILDLTDSFEKKLVEGNNQIKSLLLEFVNNMSDDEKKAMEANINDVRAKITKALEESKTTEQE